MRINYKKKTLISPEERASAEVEYMVDSAKLQFKADVLETQKQLREAKTKYEELKTEYPLDCEAIINAQVEYEQWEDGLKRLNALGTELGFNE